MKVKINIDLKYITDIIMLSHILSEGIKDDWTKIVGRNSAELWVKGMISKAIRIVLSVFGLIGFVWFMLPVFLYGILNIGNLTGVVITLCIFACAVLWPRIHNGICILLQKKVGKAIFAVVVAICLIAVATGICETVLMARAANVQPESSETVILLGCGVKGVKPTLLMRERLEAAYHYLNQNPEAVCILSGGQGADEGISEAECMYRYLIEKGIAPSRLLKEDKSTSTRENLLFSKKILTQHNFSTDVAIVTNEFHEYRAGRIASSLGLKPSAVSAKTAWWMFPMYYVRELYGIVSEWVF